MHSLPNYSSLVTKHDKYPQKLEGYLEGGSASSGGNRYAAQMELADQIADGEVEGCKNNFLYQIKEFHKLQCKKVVP